MNSRTFPAFLDFHQENNCFGYVRNERAFTNGVHHNSIRSHNRLGSYQLCHCGDQSRKIVVELFGNFPFSHISVNSVLGSAAGFKPNDEIIATSVDPVPCVGVEIAPESANDFEILERCKTSVENTLLHQISVVQKNMVFPLWISSSVSIKFRIVSVVPDTDSPVYLADSSELYVIPFIDSKNPPKTISDEDSANPDKIINTLSENLTDDFSLKTFESLEESCILRCLPKFLSEKVKGFANEPHPTVIYAINKGCKYSSCKLTKIKRNDNSEPLFAVFVQLNDFPEHSDNLMKGLHCLLKDRRQHFATSSDLFTCYTEIQCSPVEVRKVVALRTCCVFVNNKQRDTVLEEEIVKQLESLCYLYPILFPISGVLFNLYCSEQSISIRLFPSSSDVTKSKFDKNSICFAATKSTKFSIIDNEEDADSDKPLELTDSNVVNFGFQKIDSPFHLECQSEIVKNLSNAVEHSFQPSSSANSIHSSIRHCLLLGKEGSGKTSVVTRLARRLAKSSRCFFSTRIDCSSFKGKQSDNVEKILDQELAKLRIRKPSFLILDGLDFFHLQNEEEHRQLAIERLFNMIVRKLQSSPVPIVATARSLQTLHKSLCCQGGKRIFADVVEISTLNQKHRLDVLKKFLEPDTLLTDGDRATMLLTDAAKATTNFTIFDLKQLAMRIRIEARLRDASNLDEEAINNALKHSKPTGYVSEKPKVGHSYSLKDVGGMEKQKQLFTEVFLWPTKYAEIYENCGVKLGRGIVLHGESGCGKTLLANAFAAHTGFNIISIKGPELLSKYIGSSEENVRQVFERARASSPCVVIFDELDALAPKRGHDSTGVTDRVVNQLLTELDGAEGLRGVFVIGCTSRLDMIDGALLRPGRFDHIVHCGLPDEKERSSIIKIVLSSVKHDHLSPTELAMMTSGFSGADLKALITNAHFEASRRQKDSPDLMITMADINTVFEDSRPKERKSQISQFRAGQRVTLA